LIPIFLPFFFFSAILKKIIRMIRYRHPRTLSGQVAQTFRRAASSPGGHRFEELTVAPFLLFKESYTTLPTDRG
jgi:hypothetical protein